MPRLSRSLLLTAHTSSPLLPLLLRTTRDLPSARNELRWLRDHALSLSKTRARRPPRAGKSTPEAGWRALLHRFCRQRARGKPLQYILGTEFFGDLELRCRPGVLVPRQDTATSVTHLTHLLRRSGGLQSNRQVKVLDLCSGTGCMSLLFTYELLKGWKGGAKELELKVMGVDVSPVAVRLARENRGRVGRQVHAEGEEKVENALEGVEYVWGDVLAPATVSVRSERVKEDIVEEAAKDVRAKKAPDIISVLRARGQPSWDVILANPPYISPREFHRSTARSVRNFEPRLALVPPPPSTTARPVDGIMSEAADHERGDMFYPRLLETADEVDAKIVLVEVADLEQALRVARMVEGRGRDGIGKAWTGMRIWRDEPAVDRVEEHEGFKVYGEGNGRSVLCYRGDGAHWIGATDSV